MLKKTLLVVAFLALSPTVLACQFNTDCGVGSKCVKERGKIEGYCAGGLNPGNDSDRKPYRNPLDINQTEGNTCNFNTDCGPGSMCKKSGIKGVCVRKR